MKALFTDKKMIIAFIGGWLLLNLVQAAFTELHDDEAYYWLYARFLDWGYFDHPPMVALFIRAGTALFHHELTLRLLTVLSNTAAVYMLWLLARPYAVNARLFVLLFSGIVLFHVYGFITTPDSPLFFFSVLFFYVYKKYLDQDSYLLAVLLAFIVALMLYSKYHAVLVFLCCTLANWQLLKRPSFWLIACISLLLFFPHIRWQVVNDYPSIQFHVIDRSAKPYKWNYTSDFILGQLLVAGPLTGWFLYYQIVRLKTSDTFLKALKVNFIGITIFFFVSTFKGNVQPHWTLLGFISFFLLSAVYLAGLKHIPAWFMRLTYANIGLLLLVRLLFMLPIPGLAKLPALKNFNGNRAWARAVNERAADRYVVIDGGFQRASVYDFYNKTVKGFAYDSRDYRKTQFDRWPIEDSLRNKNVYYVTEWPLDMAGQDTMFTSKGVFYGRQLDSVRLYQKLTIRAEGLDKTPRVGSEQIIRLHISNPYQDTLNFSNAHTRWHCYLEYGYTKQVYEPGSYTLVDADIEHLKIAPGETKAVTARIANPPAPGKYMLIFSVRTVPFLGSRNSDKYIIEAN